MNIPPTAAAGSSQGMFWIPHTPHLLEPVPIYSGAPEDNITLTDVVTPEILRPLSSDPVVQTQVEPHLPPTSERLDVVLTSPQFQQALGTFSGALQSGQLGPLMGQFGLGGDVVSAANTGSE